ncbi:DNA polymerase III subunit alpha [compost metagenome]
MVSYQTAWLKYYYPVEFMAAQLTSEADDMDKTIANLNEARRMGIHILPPDINKSEIGYTIERKKVYTDPGDESTAEWVDAIRMGMLSIKGIGGGVITEITNARDGHEVLDANGNPVQVPGGQFKEFNDFFGRVPARTVNKSAVEKLIMTGVFDAFEPNRYALLNHFFFTIRKAKPYGGTVEQYYENKASKDKTKKPKDTEYPFREPKQYSDDMKLAWEKESLGVFVSGHPLEELPYKAWSTILDNEPVKMGGSIKNVKKIKTKTGKNMAFVKLETQGEDVECTIFPNDFEEYKDRLYKGNIVIMSGKKQVQSGGKEGLLVDGVSLPRKKKFRVDKPDDEEATDIPSEPSRKRQQTLEDLKHVVKDDPLAALFNP